MKIIEGLVHGSPEWLEWRRSGLGSSDIAAICSVSPYQTPLDIYNDKLGFSTNRRNGAMQRGIDFEGEARSVFERSHGKLRWEPMNIEHDTIFKASLDGYNHFTNTILEIKVPNRKVLDMARYGQIPVHYLYQIQWQLFVSGCPKAFYFCYSPDSLESHVVEVYPDDALIENMVEKAKRFWLDLENGIPPPDKRLKKEASEESSAILKRMLECKTQEKLASEEYGRLLKELIEVEGVEDGIECDCATLSLQERSSVDYKRAVEDAGIDVEAYRKPATKVWVIRAKGKMGGL